MLIFFQDFVGDFLPIGPFPTRPLFELLPFSGDLRSESFDNLIQSDASQSLSASFALPPAALTTQSLLAAEPAVVVASKKRKTDSKSVSKRASVSPQPHLAVNNIGSSDSDEEHDEFREIQFRLGLIRADGSAGTGASFGRDDNDDSEDEEGAEADDEEFDRIAAMGAASASEVKASDNPTRRALMDLARRASTMDPAEVKRLRRKLKNRLAAQASRERKQVHLRRLEDHIRVLEEHARALATDRMRLKKSNRALQQQLRDALNASPQSSLSSLQASQPLVAAGSTVMPVYVFPNLPGGVSGLTPLRVDSAPVSQPALLDQFCGRTLPDAAMSTPSHSSMESPPRSPGLNPVLLGSASESSYSMPNSAPSSPTYNPLRSPSAGTFGLLRSGSMLLAVVFSFAFIFQLFGINDSNLLSAPANAPAVKAPVSVPVVSFSSGMNSALKSPITVSDSATHRSARVLLSAKDDDEMSAPQLASALQVLLLQPTIALETLRRESALESMVSERVAAAPPQAAARALSILLSLSTLGRDSIHGAAKSTVALPAPHRSKSDLDQVEDVTSAPNVEVLSAWSQFSHRLAQHQLNQWWLPALRQSLLHSPSVTPVNSSCTDASNATANAPYLFCPHAFQFNVDTDLDTEASSTEEVAPDSDSRALVTTGHSRRSHNGKRVAPISKRLGSGRTSTGQATDGSSLRLLLPTQTVKSVLSAMTNGTDQWRQSANRSSASGGFLGEGTDSVSEVVCRITSVRELVPV
jgi:hypothetical protein